MKIIFIYTLDDIQSTSKPLRSWATIQFGISYISSFLKSHGHKTSLLVLGRNKWKENKLFIRSSVEEFGPDLISFTATFSQYSFIEKIAHFTKSQWPDKFQLIGGVHATLYPNKVINGPFDALCLGEGEYPTLELCSQLEGKEAPHGIANLWIKSHDGKIERNIPRNFFQNLDVLQFPDREMWKHWMKILVQPKSSDAKLIMPSAELLSEDEVLLNAEETVIVYFQSTEPEQEFASNLGQVVDAKTGEAKNPARILP